MDTREYAELSRRVKDWFNEPEQVSYYSTETSDGLTQSEEFLCSNYVEPTSQILDFGCGTGRVTHILGKRGFKVVGVDIAKELLSQAKLLNDSGNVSFMEVDNGLSLPFPGQSFDVVICFKVYCYIPTSMARRLFLNEMHRVLVPGGRLIMIQHIVPDAYFHEHKDIHYDSAASAYRTLESGDTFPAGRGYVHWFTAGSLRTELDGSDQFLVDLFESDENYGGEGFTILGVLTRKK